MDVLNLEKKTTIFTPFVNGTHIYSRIIKLLQACENYKYVPTQYYFCVK